MINRVYMVVIDITQEPYKADPTNTIDVSKILEHAIETSTKDNPNHGVKILFPRGQYKFEYPVRISRSVIIEGEVGEGAASGNAQTRGYEATRIIADPGITPFQFWNGGKDFIVQESDVSNGEGSEIRDLAIESLGNDSLTQIGDLDESNLTIELNGKEYFRSQIIKLHGKWENAREGQLIVIPAAGPGEGGEIPMSSIKVTFQ